MKRLFFLINCWFFVACSGSNGPDVSKLEVTFETVRFEKDFFSIDTNNISGSLAHLSQKYPGFLRDYLQNILGITSNDTQATTAIKQFVHDYRPVYDSALKLFPELDQPRSEIVQALKHVKYYFPSYRLPQQLISFIGPMDGYGDVITSDGLAIGLQLHMGANFSMYKSEMGLSLYPAYISRRFTPEYIAVNCIKNIIDDIYPDNNTDMTLIGQMVEKGRRIYLLDRLMPGTQDSLKTGYTGRQLEGCFANEGLIWNYFIRNGLVYNNDPSLIKNYIGESPNTPEFGEGAPGNIGAFVGWQIVKNYMAKNPSVALGELMTGEPKAIFEKSGYRPK